MRGVLTFTPLDLIDLLLDLQRLEIVEFRFMGLELGVELVLAGLFLRARMRLVRTSHQSRGKGAAHHLIALEQDDPASLVSGSKVVARRVELDRRDDVGWRGGVMSGAETRSGVAPAAQRPVISIM